MRCDALKFRGIRSILINLGRNASFDINYQLMCVFLRVYIHFKKIQGESSETMC